MIGKTILILTSIFFISTQLLAVEDDIIGENLETKPHKFMFFFGRTNGSSFYDIEGENVTSLSQSQGEFEEPIYYTFNYSKYILGLAGEWKINDKLSLYGELPFHFHHLKEKYTDTLVYISEDKQDTIEYEDISIKNYNRNQFEYLKLGGEYRFYEREAYASFLFEGKMPFGFESSVIPDDSSEFLSDGAFEAFAGLKIGMDLDKIEFQSSILYNVRAEELEDQFIINTSVGIKTVEFTALSAFLEYAQSLESFNNTPHFHPRYTTVQENYFDLGFSFEITLSNKYYLHFIYKLTLFGKNTWNKNTPIITAGYVF